LYEEVYRALSSKSRADILKLLYKKPHSIEELAEKLMLRPITVRHHIQCLTEAGILESYEERSGTSGRPTNYYKIAKKLPIVNFPERRYFLLASFLIDTLQLNLGKEKTKELLTNAGWEMGREVIKQLEQKYNVKKWSPKVFADFFVNRYLEEIGAEPELVATDDKHVFYRLHNCIFFELALQKPSLMCDILHKQFHQGVCAAIGKSVKDTQKTCMGHGDNYCEHVVQWK